MDGTTKARAESLISSPSNKGQCFISPLSLTLETLTWCKMWANKQTKVCWEALSESLAAGLFHSGSLWRCLWCFLQSLSSAINVPGNMSVFTTIVMIIWEHYNRPSHEDFAVTIIPLSVLLYKLPPYCRIVFASRSHRNEVSDRQLFLSLINDWLYFQFIIWSIKSPNWLKIAAYIFVFWDSQVDALMDTYHHIEFITNLLLINFLND